MYGLGERDFNDVVIEVAVVAEESAPSADVGRRQEILNDTIESDNGLAIIRGQVESDLTTPISSSVIGKTIDSYISILSWNCMSYSKKTLVLARTHSGNDLKYRIRGFAKSGSIYYNELWADILLAHENTQPFIIEGQYSMVTVEVKSATVGKVSSYNLDYCGGS